jgi:hypothetical protein
MKFEIGGFYKHKDKKEYYCLHIIVGISAYTFDGTVLIAEDGYRIVPVSSLDGAADEYRRIEPNEWFDYLRLLAEKREKAVSLAESGLILPRQN